MKLEAGTSTKMRNDRYTDTKAKPTAAVYVMTDRIFPGAGCPTKGRTVKVLSCSKRINLVCVSGG